jgi:hypothetical protein
MTTYFRLGPESFYILSNKGTQSVYIKGEEYYCFNAYGIQQSKISQTSLSMSILIGTGTISFMPTAY